MLHVWGCGKFGQHGKETRSNVSPKDGVVEGLKHEQVKLVSCGTSHTIVVAGRDQLIIMRVTYFELSSRQLYRIH